MHPKALQYLLDELPNLKKIFSNRESETISFDVMVQLAIMVECNVAMLEKLEAIKTLLENDA